MMRRPGILSAAMAGIAIALVPMVSSASEDQATIITSMSQASNCISPVEINNIDHRPVNPRPMFKLDPGEYRLMGRGMINTLNCPSPRGNRRYEVAPLEMEFEAGVTYYVGLDHSSNSRNDWKIVSWKTEGGDAAGE